MKKVPNNIVAELVRLLPLILENTPRGKSSRIDNAIRLLGITAKKLKKINNEKD